MSSYVELLWEEGGYGPRKDRASYTYRAYVPDEIADWEPALPSGAATALDRATRALATLNAGVHAADLEALAGPLLRAEAVGSSFIEGLSVSHKNLAIADYENRAATSNARAVLGNVRAMERAIELATRPEPLDVDALLDVHNELLRYTTDAALAGKVRATQNWIGGRAGGPRGADFVPPPSERVPALLDDLVVFCNRDDLPPILQAAIAHAQFETIHPFADGNGRTGRCLVHVILRRRGAAPKYSPPVSVVLASNARKYVRGLTAYRDGDVNEWSGLFADAVRVACESAEELGTQLTEFTQRLLAQAGKLRSDAVARKIIRDLPAHPIVSADTVAETYEVSLQAARSALNTLQSRGALSLTRVGRRRDREWSNDGLFDLLDNFDYGATPV